MENTSENNANQFHRRRFISDGVKITLLASVLSPLEQACNTKSNKKDSSSKQTTAIVPKKKKQTAKEDPKRRRWIRENLVINTKSNVAHFPTGFVYVYYDEIKRTKDVSINNWESENIKFNKARSGHILEILSLQKLKGGVNDRSLADASSVLSRAFGVECENKKGTNLNLKNCRLHELMLQLVALNGDISESKKWQRFNELVKKPPRLGKRQAWMADENSFNERIKYILGKKEDYKNRLVQRAGQYNLT
jgi:hypothetical protein